MIYVNIFIMNSPICFAICGSGFRKEKADKTSRKRKDTKYLYICSRCGNIYTEGEYLIFCHEKNILNKVLQSDFI